MGSATHRDQLWDQQRTAHKETSGARADEGNILENSSFRLASARLHFYSIAKAPKWSSFRSETTYFIKKLIH